MTSEEAINRAIRAAEKAGGPTTPDIMIAHSTRAQAWAAIATHLSSKEEVVDVER